MNEIRVSKAQRVGTDDVLPSVCISIEYELPTYKTPVLGREQFYREAREIETALYGALPGGTYDRLAELILARIASQLRVSHNRRGGSGE